MRKKKDKQKPKLIITYSDKPYKQEERIKGFAELFLMLYEWDLKEKTKKE